VEHTNKIIVLKQTQRTKLDQFLTPNGYHSTKTNTRKSATTTQRDPHTEEVRIYHHQQAPVHNKHSENTNGR